MDRKMSDMWTPMGMMDMSVDMMQRTTQAFTDMWAGPPTAQVTERVEIVEKKPAPAGIKFPDLAIGDHEEVLIFDVLASAELTFEPNKTEAYWHVWGRTTNLDHHVLRGTFFDTVFPFPTATAPQMFAWPPPQGGPFNRPPVDPVDTKAPGYSKTQFTFEDGSTIVTVGPSIPKLDVLKGGDGQLWVTSVGVMTEGTGRYEGARALAAFNGSAYLKKMPDFATKAGRQELEEGFQVNVSINIKVIPKEHLQ